MKGHLVNKQKSESGSMHLIIIAIVLVLALLVGTYVLQTSKSRNEDISTEAKNSTSRTTANAFLTVAELFNEDNGHYPTTTGDFSKKDYGITINNFTILPEAKNSPLNSSNGLHSVTWSCLITCENPKGGKIMRWNFTTNTVETIPIYVGDAKSGSIFVSPKS